VLDGFLESAALRALQMRSLLFDYGTSAPDTHKKEPPPEEAILL